MTAHPFQKSPQRVADRCSSGPDPLLNLDSGRRVMWFPWVFFLLGFAYIFAETPIPPVKLYAQPLAQFSLDGSPTEWGTPPSVTLGPSNQILGKRRVLDKADCSGRFWLVLNKGGLTVAGEVRDQDVRLPKTEADMFHQDHVELWLAFPEPVIPPISLGEGQNFST